MQPLVIGIDGGGTSTRALVLNLGTRALSRGESAGCNPNNVGLTHAAAAIIATIAGGKATLSRGAALCCGIAGLASEALTKSLRAELLRQEPALRAAHLHLTHDLAIAHHAAFGSGSGLLVIAGTGSACYGRNAAGAQARASGRAAPYDDPGSGYAIAQRARATGLAPASCDLADRSALAAEARHVFAAAQAGDTAAREILSAEAEQLAALAKTVIDIFDPDAPIPLALHGGAISASPLYRGLVEAAFLRLYPRARLVQVEASPLVGALDLAHRQATGHALPAWAKKDAQRFS